MRQGIIKSKIINALLKIKTAMAEETEATREMVSIYHDYSLGIASKETVKRANRQFGSLIRTLGLGVMVILPFSPLTLPLVVKLGKKFGIDILPDSLREK
ncbi:MAG: hypothetical protein ACUZ8E_04480 [Candidatus Anammoxibacter sp.]